MLRLGLWIAAASLPTPGLFAQSPQRLSDDQATIIYSQCLARAAVQLARTSLPDESIYPEARRGCIPLRIDVQTQAVNVVTAGARMDAVDADAAASFAEKTRKVRAMRHRFDEGAAGAAPSRTTIDATASIVAYHDWRLCLDKRLGPPPRLRQPDQTTIEAAFHQCRSHEKSLQEATAAALGEVKGREIFATFITNTRAELNLAIPRR